MPLIRIDAVKGRTPEEIQSLLDAAHRATLAAFGVPERDRYQIYQEHDPLRFIVQDTGLGIERSAKVVLISVVSKARSQEMKLNYYRLLCEELEKSCNIKPTDVVVSITSNTGDDWSFGNGIAQFVTGDL